MREPLEEPDAEQPTRYRCRLCANLTRFDVIERKRTRSFHHFTIGGMLRVEEEDVLERDIEEVRCRWCNTSENVEEIPALEVE